MKICASILAVLSFVLTAEVASADALRIDVSQAPYSADRTGTVSATSAVKEALKKATNIQKGAPGTAVEVYLPEGRYFFTEDPGMSAHIKVAGFNRGPLALRGDGPGLTHVVFGTFDQYGIRVAGASELTIEDMHLTREGNGADVPDFYSTQGTVTKLELGAVEFVVDAGFPSPVWLIQQPVAQEHELSLLRFGGDALDPHLLPNSDKIVLPTTPDAIQETETEGVFRAELRSLEWAPLAIGDKVALKAKAGVDTVRVVDCDACVYRNLRFTNMSGVALKQRGEINGAIVERIFVDRPAPVNGIVPFFSGPGGGIVISSGDVGPTITNSTVVGTADDGIAVFSENAGGSARLSVGTVIQGNMVRDNQARGILITQTQGGVARDNVLIRNTDAGILFKIETVSSGSCDSGIHDWLIQNNVMEQQWTSSALAFADECKRGGLITNVVIRENRFVDVSNLAPVVRLTKGSGVHIEDNMFLSFTATEPMDASIPLVDIGNSVEVTGVGNQLAAGIERTSDGNRGSMPGWFVGAEVVTEVFTSLGSEDGYVLEAEAGSDTGAKAQADGKGRFALRVGDTEDGRSIQSLVSFDTSSLPDDAVIVDVRLLVMPGEGLTEDGPVTWGGPCLVQAAVPYQTGFGSSLRLDAEDYSAADLGAGPVGVLVPTSNAQPEWSEAVLGSVGLYAVDLEGRTQLRLQQAISSNADGVGGYQGYFSGEHSRASKRPQLVVTYAL